MESSIAHVHDGEIGYKNGKLKKYALKIGVPVVVIGTAIGVLKDKIFSSDVAEEAFDQFKNSKPIEQLYGGLTEDGYIIPNEFDGEGAYDMGDEKQASLAFVEALNAKNVKAAMKMRSLHDMHAIFFAFSKAKVAEKDKINNLWDEYLVTDNPSPYLVKKLYNYMFDATSKSDISKINKFRIEKFDEQFINKALFGTFGVRKENSKHVAKITDVITVVGENENGSEAIFSMAKYGDKWFVLNESF